MSWEVVEVLLLYGARIYAKNSQNIYALNLVPELGRFQHFCMEEYAKAACGTPKGPNTKVSGAKLHLLNFMTSIFV